MTRIITYTCVIKTLSVLKSGAFFEDKSEYIVPEAPPACSLCAAVEGHTWTQRVTSPSVPLQKSFHPEASQCFHTCK